MLWKVTGKGRLVFANEASNVFTNDVARIHVLQMRKFGYKREVA